MDTLETRLAQLENAHLIVQAGDSEPAFIFQHALVQETSYSSILKRKRREWHRAVGNALEELYAADLDRHVQDLAFHFVASGDWNKGFNYSLRAAARAQALFAHDEALDSFQVALRCAEALQLPDNLVTVYEGIADVYTLRGPFHLAVEYFERALAIAAEDRRRAALKAKLGATLTILGDERGLELLQTARRELDPVSQRNELARATAMVGRYRHYRGQYREAIEFLEQSLQLAGPMDDVIALGDIYTYLASAYQHLAHFQHSMEWARRSIALGERKNHPHAVAVGYEFLAEDAYFCGQWKQALAYSERSKEIAEKIGAAARAAWSEYSRASALRGLGETRAAMDVIQNALRLAEGTGDRRLVVFVLAQRSMIETDLGQAQAADEDARRARERADEIGQFVMQCVSRHALGYSHLRREEWAFAAASFDECMPLLARTENRAVPLILAANRAEAYWGLGRLTEAARITAEGLALAREAQSRHYEAVALRVQGQIEMSLGALDAAMEALDAAIVIHAELASPGELAHAQDQRARLQKLMDQDGRKKL
jgi:tetratricopeptide (TPR) repeat protein